MMDALPFCPLRSRLLVLFLGVAVSDYLVPIEVIEKPPHRVLPAFFKRVAGLPPQPVSDQCGVD